MSRNRARSVLSSLPPDSLIADFDAITISRGANYLDRVESFSYGSSEPGSVWISAAVLGSRGYRYDTTVQVHVSGPFAELDSFCTCPVSIQCKHAVAALLVASADVGPPLHPDRPRWQQRLDPVLSELETLVAPDQATGPMAIQFDWEQPRYRDSEPRIRCSPRRRGKSGNWIKTGVGWRQLLSGARLGLDPQQRSAVIRLSTQLSAVTGDPDLATQGPQLWPLLQDCVDSGVTLLPGLGLAEVRLVETARIAADVRHADFGGLTLVWGVAAEENWWPSEATLLLARGTGVAAWTGSDGDRRLVLAPLPQSPAPALQRALTERVEIAPDDVTSFLRDYLPRLHGHVELRTAPGIDLPELTRPRLVATADWRKLGSLRLSWSWRYQFGETTRDFPIGSTDGAGIRRPADERDLLSRLRLPVEADPLLRDPSGGLWRAVNLRGGELVSFVEQVLPALHNQCDVEVDDLGARPDYRVTTAEPEVHFEAADGAGPDWLDLNVVITVEGQPVPLPAVLEALTLEQEWIFLPSGLRLATDHPALARLADLVRSAAELRETHGDRITVGRHDLGLWAELADLGVVDRQAAQWVNDALALRDLTELPVIAPVDLATELRSYQRTGLDWLGFLWEHRLGGILADDMGLGKTLQALGLIAHARARGSGPFLVVAPTSVVGAWAEQVARHTPGLVVRTVTASARRRPEPITELVAGCDVLVTSYTLFRIESAHYHGIGWGGLILDEAQNLKNHQAKTYQQVRKLEVPFRLALTGTPFENRLVELWSLLSIVAPGLYPWPKKFAEHVVNPVERSGDQAALTRFRRRIRPFLLRRTKELVAADLPPKQEQVTHVELDAKHRNVYDTHLQRERQHVLGLVADFDRNRIEILSSITRLRQLSLDPALLDDKYAAIGSAKLDLLVDQLRELAAEGHRALVFSQFTAFLARVRARLDQEGIEYDYLDGSTRNRPRVIDRFRNGDNPVFLISLKAGGVGLTLTEADYVFVMDPWWNPAVEAQAVDRAHRIGQERPVLVYRLVSVNTIEEKVMALKERKAALFARVLDGDGALTEQLTAADVRALFE